MFTQWGLLECAKKFARKFAAKGYFDDFQLFLSNAKTPETSGDLKYCLEEFIKDFQAGYKMTVPFILCTTADYKHDIGNINCRFEVTFDHLKGFTANSLEIEDARSGQKRFTTLIISDKYLRLQGLKHSYCDPFNRQSDGSFGR